MTAFDPADVVRSAAAGDASAWSALVQRYSRLVWSIARSHGLSSADSEDVSQTTWLRLAENLPRLRDPGSVGVWIGVTARNEALRVSRQGRRSLALAPDQLAQVLIGREPGDPLSGADVSVLAAQRDEVLWAALNELPAPCRLLLRLLVADPPLTYIEVGAIIDRPVGSIGPMRMRCLNRLRAALEALDPDRVPETPPACGVPSDSR
ncbi:MAG: sigma-70 family RNA polymerase sigma factor [Actinobacteria bacterium]|nr:sigma-70 family RNA polymerase sigma factor [Actinomycetota bacterium]